MLWFYHSQLLSLENKWLREILPKCIKTWGGDRGKKTKPETSWYCALTGQEAMNSETQKILLIIIKSFFFFCCAGGQTLQNASQGGCGVFFNGHIQKSAGWAMGDLLSLAWLEQGMDQMSSEMSISLYHNTEKWLGLYQHCWWNSESSLTHWVPSSDQLKGNKQSLGHVSEWKKLFFNF